MRTALTNILFLLLAINIYGQPFASISVITEKGITDIPSYNRENTIYFSIKDFSDAASVDYFYNPNNGKIELKFDQYLVKITAKNPYFIITEKSSGKQSIYQLPTSSYVFGDKIFIPLNFSIGPLEKALGKELNFSVPITLQAGDTVNVETTVNFYSKESKLYNKLLQC